LLLAWLPSNIVSMSKDAKVVVRRRSRSGGEEDILQDSYCIVLLRFCWDLAALENFVNVILICVEFGMASVFIFVDVQ